MHCRHYIKGDCKFGVRCRLSHNILDNQPRDVLQKFGVNVSQDPKELVRMVRFKKGHDDAVDNDVKGLQESFDKLVRNTTDDKSMQIQRQISSDNTKVTKHLLLQWI